MGLSASLGFGEKPQERPGHGKVGFIADFPSHVFTLGLILAGSVRGHPAVPALVCVTSAFWKADGSLQTTQIPAHSKENTVLIGPT